MWMRENGIVARTADSTIVAEGDHASSMPQSQHVAVPGRPQPRKSRFQIVAMWPRWSRATALSPGQSSVPVYTRPPEIPRQSPIAAVGRGPNPSDSRFPRRTPEAKSRRFAVFCASSCRPNSHVAYPCPQKCWKRAGEASQRATRRRAGPVAVVVKYNVCRWTKLW